MTVTITTLNDSCKQMLSLWEDVFPALELSGVTDDTSLNSISITFGSLDAAVRSYLHRMLQIDFSALSDREPALHLSTQFETLCVQQEHAAATLQELAHFLSQAESDGYQVHLDNERLVDSSGEDFNLSIWAADFHKHVRNAVSHFLMLFGLSASGDTAADWNASIDIYDDLVKGIRGAAKEASSSLREIQSQLNEAQEANATASNALSQIKERAGEITEDQKHIHDSKSEVDSWSSEVQAKLSNVREIASDAESLKSRVSDYQSQFDAFDKRLNQRLEKIGELEQRYNDAASNNEKREQTIEEISQKADEMLEGATIAGLSQAFHNASERYSRSANWAQIFFYLSIAVLLVSVIPLYQYVVPENDDAVITISGIVARFVLLLPGAWLTTFTAHRYWNTFQLHREYAFKEAIAMSIDGFKKQAPKYEEEIAGAAFIELSEKPEYGPSYSKGDSNPNPVLSHLIRTIQKRYPSDGAEK